jgi:hypothetical protein
MVLRARCHIGGERSLSRPDGRGHNFHYHQELICSAVCAEEVIVISNIATTNGKYGMGKELRMRSRGVGDVLATLTR